MTWRVTFSNKAIKETDRLNVATRQRVLNPLQRFADTHHGDVKKLRGSEGEWRLRVGDWRVRFEVNRITQTIRVHSVRHRREAYRD